MKNKHKRLRCLKIAIRFFLMVSILVLAYTYYRSEIIYNGALAYVYYKYYLISLLGIVFWSVVLWLRDKIKVTIVLVTSSLLLGVYLVELALDLVHITNSREAIQLAQLEGIEFDSRTAAEVNEDLKNDGVDSTLAISSLPVLNPNQEGSERLLPFGGVSNKTTVFCNESGKMIIYQSDRYGFNNPDTEWDSTQADWILIGDSFTHGACVKPNEGIAGQIRSITENSVINLGFLAQGPLLELATLKEYAEIKKPKIVIWIYYEGNDFSDLIAEKRIPLLMNYLQPNFSQNLLNRQKEIDKKIGNFIIQKSTNSWLLKWLRLKSVRALIGSLSRNLNNVDPLLNEILTEAKHHTSRWGGEFYFVYLPTYSRYQRRIREHDLYLKRNEMIALVKNLDIPIIDIHLEVFANLSDPGLFFPFGNPGHYNAEGYSTVAKAIVAGVRNEQLKEATLQSK